MLNNRKKLIFVTAIFSSILFIFGTESQAFQTNEGPVKAEKHSHINTKLPRNIKPSFITQELPVRLFDGITNDLRTGGVGSTGIQNLDTTLNGFDDGPKTADEARTIAIAKNYFTMIDAQTPGGYGVLWGPTVDNDDLDGMLGGKEYWAYIDDGTGKDNVRVVVQIPNTFNSDNPCILAGPSSGSRGVFGAIGSTGEVGLKQRCAIVYTDKGTGTGVHVLYNSVSQSHDDDVVYKLDLTASTLGTAGKEADFSVDDVDLNTFSHAYPVAFKHAHSQKNPEKNWGYFTLASIRYAFYVINLEENFGKKIGRLVFQAIRPESTIVISTSWSNGGKAVLLSGEDDREDLIDGLVAVEPNVGLDEHHFSIQQGDHRWGPESVGWSLYDFHAYQNVYQTCANLAPSNAAAYVANFNQLGAVAPTYSEYYSIAQNRCERLYGLGLLTGKYTTEDDATRHAELGTEAQEKLNTFAGLLEEQNLFQPVLPTLSEEVVATYANSYGQFNVEDQLFGISFAQVEGVKMLDRFPAPFSERDINVNMIGENLLGGISKMMKLINNNAEGGPQENYYSKNIGEEVKDGNLTAALQFYKMSLPGRAEWERAGHRLIKAEKFAFNRIQSGIKQTALTGKLHGKPIILMQGRSDEVVHINHASRAYYARYMQQGGDDAEMAFLEIKNGHHLEMYNGLLPAYGENSSYLHPYFNDAVGMMLDHLRNGTKLPGDQVVRAQKKGPSDIRADMFPEIQMVPDDADAIIWNRKKNTLMIPD